MVGKGAGKGAVTGALTGTLTGVVIGAGKGAGAGAVTVGTEGGSMVSVLGKGAVKVEGGLGNSEIGGTLSC